MEPADRRFERMILEELYLGVSKVVGWLYSRVSSIIQYLLQSSISYNPVSTIIHPKDPQGVVQGGVSSI